MKQRWNQDVYRWVPASEQMKNEKADSLAKSTD